MLDNCIALIILIIMIILIILIILMSNIWKIAAVLALECGRRRPALKATGNNGNESMRGEGTPWFRNKLEKINQGGTSARLVRVLVSKFFEQVYCSWWGRLQENMKSTWEQEPRPNFSLPNPPCFSQPTPVGGRCEMKRFQPCALCTCSSKHSKKTLLLSTMLMYSVSSVLQFATFLKRSFKPAKSDAW